MLSERNALVTGGLGFIGKNFCNIIQHQYSKIYIVDKFSKYSDLEYYNLFLKGCDLEIARVKDIDLNKYLHFNKQIDIFHFASESHVDDSFINAPDFAQSNYYDTCCLLEKIKSDKNSIRLIYISTDEVYGEILDEPADENTILDPTNPYAATKAAADILVQTYMKCYGINAKIIRANNIYGTGQHVSKLIPKSIFSANSGLKFLIHGNGEQRRHFLHTLDFTKAILNLLDKWNSLDDYIFNIAGDTEWQVMELVNFIYTKCAAPRDNIIFSEDRPFNDKRYFVDDSKIRETGWSPSVNFEEKISEMCINKDYFSGQN